MILLPDPDLLASYVHHLSAKTGVLSCDSEGAQGVVSGIRGPSCRQTWCQPAADRHPQAPAASGSVLPPPEPSEAGASLLHSLSLTH